MSNTKHSHALVIGIGNNGRGDDGLGWAFIEAIRKAGYLGDTVLRYQLQVEDAELISRYQSVLFVDAYKPRLREGFEISICIPANDFSFSTHQLSPASVLCLCRELYQTEPQTYLMLISGRDWRLQLSLSTFAKNNLDSATNFFYANCQKSLSEVAPKLFPDLSGSCNYPLKSGPSSHGHFSTDSSRKA
ncbi:MAG: hydrogenase maturation protease [Saprospiraceae bacterium]|nr:hydrogenase maturation protease [Saprospiraceae bacterium]